jgi:hypothetical protein
VRKEYKSKERKSIHKFEIVRGQELLVQVPVVNGRRVGGDASSGRRTRRAGQAADPAGHSGERSHPPGGASASAESECCVRCGKQPGYPWQFS